MSDIEKRLADIRERAEKATKGPWETDSVKTEGEYGTGDDTHTGFDEFIVYGDNGKQILTTDGAEGMIEEDFDEDGYHSAWNEESRCNTDFIAHARSDIPFLLNVIERLAAERDAAQVAAERDEETAYQSAMNWLRERLQTSSSWTSREWFSAGYTAAIRALSPSTLSKPE